MVLFLYEFFSEKWNSIKVSPVKFQNEEKSEVIVCDKEEAEFWSVYIHLIDGRSVCVADVSDEKTADDFANLLMSVSANFVGE